MVILRAIEYKNRFARTKSIFNFFQRIRRSLQMATRGGAGLHFQRSGKIEIFVNLFFGKCVYYIKIPFWYADAFS